MLFKNNKKKTLYLIITGIGIVLFWRGIWLLLDEFLFPNNLVLSASISVVVGLLILYINDRSLKELE